jgi:hypothetical protein
VFFVATCSALVPPTISIPKFKLDVNNEMVRVAGVPLPLNAMVCVESVALLLIVMVPVTLPVAVGANATVKFKVFAGASVNGVEIPLNLNPVPLTVALEIVRLAAPVFFSCTVCEFVVPSGTLPKLMLDGVVVNIPRPSTCPFAVPGEEIAASRNKKLQAKYRQLRRQRSK